MEKGIIEVEECKIETEIQKEGNKYIIYARKRKQDRPGNIHLLISFDTLGEAENFIERLKKSIGRE